MKINAVISKPSIMKKNYKSPSKALIISFIIILIGIALSAILFRFNNSEMSGKLMKYFTAFQTDFSNKTFLEIFSGIFIGYLPLVITVFILGTCSFGAAPVLLSILLYSFAMGTLVSYLLSAYSLTGIEYYLLILFPGKIFAIFALLLLSEITASSAIKIKELSEQKAGEGFNRKMYYLRCIVIMGIFALSALTDTFTIKVFSPLFPAF